MWYINVKIKVYILNISLMCTVYDDPLFNSLCQDRYVRVQAGRNTKGTGANSGGRVRKTRPERATLGAR
jgi:hypothetical protein